MGRTDRISFVGVLGLTSIALVVLVLGALLSFNGILVPSSWETMAGAAVGSLGTLIVTRANGDDSPDVEALRAQIVGDLQRMISQQIVPTPAPTQPRPPQGAFSQQSAPPTLKEEGFYEGE